MRSVVLVCAFGLVCLLLPSCQMGEKGSASGSTDAGTYTCPTCKDAVAWSYSSKPVPANLRKVEHTCPMCKKTWEANVSAQSHCADCAKKDMACPMCKKASG